MVNPIVLKTDLGSKLTTLDVGRIVRVGQLPDDVTGTLIDPEILKNGTRIDLPFPVKDIFDRKISFIDVPQLSPDGRIEKSGDMYFLHPLTVAANAIIAHQVQTEGKADRKNLQRLVDAYYSRLVSRITGHRGIIAKGVAGTRMSHSGRLVLIPQIERSPEWVALSAQAMKTAKIEEGDLILIFRDPVIWTGSVEVVKAYPCDDDIIALHPLLFDQLGADCDGDQVAYVKPDYEVPGVLDELKENLLKHTKANAKWPKMLCPNDLPREPDWNNIEADTARRFVVTGASYGPRDITAFSDTLPKNVQLMEAISGKSFGMTNKKIATDESFNWDLLVSTNHANVYMKKFLGVVGAVSRRLLLVAGEDPWLKESVNRISETIQQTTLDAKHKVGEKKVASPIDIMQLFERQGSWAKASIQSCVELLKTAEVSEEDALRMILHFRVELPLHLLIENNIKSEDYQNEAKKAIRRAITDDNGNARSRFDLLPALDLIASFIRIETDGKCLLTGLQIHDDSINYRYGLRDIVKLYYPGYDLISKGTTKDIKRAVSCYSLVFHKKITDRNSLFKRVFPDLKEPDATQQADPILAEGQVPSS